MQFEAPEAFDLSRETDETLRLYGLERGDTESFGWQCLVARRLAERGVRFIELIDTGSSNNWDAHSDMAAHEPLARKIDQPIAGLLNGPQARGMLDDTLVVWTTEFGRTPGTDGPKGRGHPPGVLHLVAGRRRRQGRHRLRRDRRHRLPTVAEKRSTSTTSTPRSCTCWASTTHEADLPPRRPRLPPGMRWCSLPKGPFNRVRLHWCRNVLQSEESVVCSRL